MSKVMTLKDAIAKYVHSGDHLALGGFTTDRKPYAAVYEILRQGITDLTGLSGAAGGDWDMLIGCGRVKAYINCYTANSGVTNVPDASVNGSKRANSPWKIIPRMSSI